MRLRERIDQGKVDGKFYWWPIVRGDKGGKILWPGKYPDQTAIEKQRREIGNCDI